MTVYYNEIDPFSAEWLRQLIYMGCIAPGVVDERSIEDVTPSDLQGFTQCHFFAGIGGWSYALRLAGWSDEKNVWTGSCPCQPFSQAGKGGGFDDERHLWPVFHWLIQQCKPTRIYGEQVATKASRDWLDFVFTDLEAADYACAAANLCAAGVGAPQARQRLYWMADASYTGLEGRPSIASIHQPRERETWSRCMVIRDNKQHARIIEPELSPLAHGVPGRVGLVRGYGNAIVPEVAAAFIEATQ